MFWPADPRNAVPTAISKCIFWLWSLTLKFRNSRELWRIQQPVCQLTGTKDVASKLLPSIHVPGPHGNTNTLEACEFKLTLRHGLQNTWSYWWKRRERKRACKTKMCHKSRERIQRAVTSKSLWNNDSTLAAKMQKLKNNSSSNGNNCKADAINFSSRLQASYKSSCACEKPVTHFQHIFSRISSSNNWTNSFLLP